MMYQVYILRSLKNGKRYVGFTSRKLQIRLHEHAGGQHSWTRQNGLFELVYVENYFDKTKAQQRERFLKSGHGRELLNKILSVTSITHSFSQPAL